MLTVRISEIPYVRPQCSHSSNGSVTSLRMVLRIKCDSACKVLGKKHDYLSLAIMTKKNRAEE